MTLGVEQWRHPASVVAVGSVVDRSAGTQPLGLSTRRRKNEMGWENNSGIPAEFGGLEKTGN